MATPIETILKWYKEFDFPTEQQFRQSWTSFWHKDEKIPQSSIENLTIDLDNKAEREQLDRHTTDPDAHADLFAQFTTPYKYLTNVPGADADNLVIPELIGAELDAVMYRGQVVDADEITLDTVTGTLSNWDFKAGVKYIIFYTKI
ncbi:hypothetical protein [Flavobacterium cerinum]|uniref:Uncharacterized protein n=1 Tax=Flavobacterium cerinum TaxID=2502784 RepID=A0A444HBY4_9FLAO|nr:hypothetical protein [Flavobacterium cerinum]RWX00903.1 hypothetical protein EPI11_07735 [Flavobacterium cerinum]